MDALTSPAIHCFGDQQELLLERLALLRRTQPGLHRLGLLHQQRFVEFKLIALNDSLLKLHGKVELFFGIDWFIRSMDVLLFVVGL